MSSKLLLELELGLGSSARINNNPSGTKHRKRRAGITVLRRKASYRILESLSLFSFFDLQRDAFVLSILLSVPPTYIQFRAWAFYFSFTTLRIGIMWFSTSLSAALWLAACVMAGIHDQTTTNADGIRSIPVCLPRSSSRIEEVVC